MAQDSEIVRRVTDGDVNAFEVLIDRHRRLVFGIVRKHVPADKVEDVAHEVFIEAFRSLGAFSEKSPFSYWLAKITVRCCYRFWRRHHRNRELPVSSISEQAQQWLDAVTGAASRAAFEREAARKEAAEVLDHALGKLAPKDRMVVTMVHLEERSVQEVAAQLGWSLVAVKVRAHRSRQKLRKIISGLLENKPGK
jgi:RNA polymerase sigma-70 factor, ECF subfamily